MVIDEDLRIELVFGMLNAYFESDLLFR
jgi:hypothetical protein